VFVGDVKVGAKLAAGAVMALAVLMSLTQRR
jgi:hypothetical protein